VAKHLGNITVTKDNQLNFPAVSEIYGHLTIAEDATLVAPSLVMVRGWVTVHGKLAAMRLGLIDGWLNLQKGMFSAIHLSEVRADMTIGETALLDLPALDSVGSINLLRGASKKLVSLTTVRDSVTVQAGASLSVPLLRTVGRSITLRENARLDVPELAHIGGYYDADPSAAIVAPKFVGG